MVWDDADADVGIGDGDDAPNGWPVAEYRKFIIATEEGTEGEAGEKKSIIDEIAEGYERDGWRAVWFKGYGKQEEEGGIGYGYDKETMERCMREWEGYYSREIPVDGQGEGQGWADAVRDFQKTTTTWSNDEGQKSALTVKMLELALVLNDEIKDVKGFPNVDEILGVIAKRIHSTSQIQYLTQSRKAWSILRDGALAKKMGISEERVKEVGEQVISTMKKRFENGPDSPMAGKTIRELVDIISENTISNEGARQFWDEIGADSYPSTLLRQPAASSIDIAALEERLQVVLPEDFKEFLAYTNGLDESWTGIIFESPLHSATDICWYGDDPHHYMTEILSDLPAELLGINVFQIDRDLDYNTLPKVNRAIEIGNQETMNLWLLPVEAVNSAREMYAQTRGRSDVLQRYVDMGIREFCGGMEEWEKLEWVVLGTWLPEIQGWASFRKFLEHRAVLSMENRWER